MSLLAIITKAKYWWKLKFRSASKNPRVYSGLDLEHFFHLLSPGPNWISILRPKSVRLPYNFLGILLRVLTLLQTSQHLPAPRRARTSLTCISNNAGEGGSVRDYLRVDKCTRARELLPTPTPILFFSGDPREILEVTAAKTRSRSPKPAVVDRSRCSGGTVQLLPLYSKLEQMGMGRT